MELYLLRHGDARSVQEDPERSLSERGRREVERVARAAAVRGVAVERIYHSGKLRAAQTAEIVAGHLEPHQGVSSLRGLAPNDDPDEARRFAEQTTKPLLLVGHLPHLSRLGSLLLLGDVEPQVLVFQPATLAALMRDEGRWLLRWHLPPELVPR
jgi:phosphohistidine phosphatase